MRFDSTLIGFCFVLATFPAAARGSGGDATSDSAHKSGEVAQHEASGGHEGHAAMPTMPGIQDPAKPAPEASAWVDLKATRDAIAQIVASGKLAGVHEKSERLEPLGRALVDGAKSLPDEKRTRIQATLRQLPQLSKSLHEAADSGNADAARRELKRLDGLLALIEAQYPTAALTHVPAPTDAQAGHVHSEGEPAGHEHGAHVHAARPLAAVDEAPKATLHVKSGEFTFEPKSLAMKAGEPTRIELENEGAIEHALIVAAPDGKGDWIHLHATANATDALTFRIDKAGTYRVLCTIPGHTEAGMVGELVVQ